MTDIEDLVQELDSSGSVKLENILFSIYVYEVQTYVCLYNKDTAPTSSVKVLIMQELYQLGQELDCLCPFLAWTSLPFICLSHDNSKKLIYMHFTG